MTHQSATSAPRLSGSDADLPPTLVKAFEALPEEFHPFAPVYLSDVLPRLQGFESQRKATLAKGKQFSLYGAIAGAVGVGVAFLTQHPLGAFIGVGGGLAAAAFGFAGLTGLAAKLKGHLIEPVASQLGLTFEQKPTDTSLIQTMRTLRLVPSWDRASYEDRVVGERRGVPFELFEAHLEDERTTTDSKGNTRTEWVTVFKGQVMVFRAHKTFHGITMLLRDAGIFNSLGGIGSDLKRARLEDPDFEKAFEVYTNDQVEARYLLTPDMLAKFTALEASLKGKNLTACYRDNQLFITVQNGNLFEPKGILNRPIDDPERAAELLADFGWLFRIIDDLAEPERQGR
jgi:hypothetical protein